MKRIINGFMLKLIFFAVTCVCTAILSSGSAFAEVARIGTTPYDSLKAAVDAAHSGDEIYLCEGGVYLTEEIVIKKPNIKIIDQSGGEILATPDFRGWTMFRVCADGFELHGCTVNASSANRDAVIVGRESGTSKHYGHIRCVTIESGCTADVEFENCYFRNEYCDLNGSIIAFYDSQASVGFYNCAFYAETSGNGGILAILGTSYPEVVFGDCMNECSYAGSNGGIFYIGKSAGGSVTFSNCQGMMTTFGDWTLCQDWLESMKHAGVSPDDMEWASTLFAALYSVADENGATFGSGVWEPSFADGVGGEGFVYSWDSVDICVDGACLKSYAAPTSALFDFSVRAADPAFIEDLRAEAIFSRNYCYGDFLEVFPETGFWYGRYLQHDRNIYNIRQSQSAIIERYSLPINLESRSAACILHDYLFGERDQDNGNAVFLTIGLESVLSTGLQKLPDAANWASELFHEKGLFSDGYVESGITDYVEGGEVPVLIPAVFGGGTLEDPFLIGRENACALLFMDYGVCGDFGLYVAPEGKYVQITDEAIAAGCVENHDPNYVLTLVDPDNNIYYAGEPLITDKLISTSRMTFAADVATGARTVESMNEILPFAHSVNAWGEASAAEQATISYRKDGAESQTMGEYADADVATWVPSGNGTYLFQHTPGSGITATFNVGFPFTGTGTEEDPYVVLTAKGLSVVAGLGGWVRLGADIISNATLPADLALYLDLNGLTLSGTMINNGTLTLLDGAGGCNPALDITGSGTVIDNMVKVDNLVFKQRYPWNGLVDVSYEASGLLEGKTYEVRFTLTKDDVTKAFSLTNVVNGTNKHVWNAAAPDAFGVGVSNATVNVEAVIYCTSKKVVPAQ